MIAVSEINRIIVRQLQRHKLEYEIDLDPNQDNQKVVFCDDENLGQQRIFKECSEDELTLLFSALIENKALYWDQFLPFLSSQKLSPGLSKSTETMLPPVQTHDYTQAPHISS